MTTKSKTSEHLEEQELNKLLKYLYQNEEWTYYLFVRLGVSTALRYSDLSKITWSQVLNQEKLTIKEENRKDKGNPNSTGAHGKNQLDV